MGAGLYAREALGLKGDALGAPPPVDLATEIRNSVLVRALIKNGVVSAVHDLSEGGLACCAAELALGSGHSLTLDVSMERLSRDRDDLIPFLFGEDQGRYLIAVKPDQENSFHDITDKHADVPVLMMGSVEIEDSRDEILFSTDVRAGTAIRVTLSKLREAHESWMPDYMNAIG